MPSPWLVLTAPPSDIPQPSSWAPDTLASLSHLSPTSLPPYREEETNHHDIWDLTCGINVGYTFNVKEVPLHGTIPEGQGPSANNSAYAEFDIAAAANMDSHLMHPDANISGTTFPSELEHELETLDRFCNSATASTQVPSSHIVPGSSATSGASDTVEPLKTSSPVVTHCKWPGTGNSGTCDAQITQEVVPTHFRAFHGIRKMREDTLINCQWEGCHKRLIRKNFVRHTREHHLGCPRKKQRSSGS